MTGGATLTALRWGLPGAVPLLTGLIIKTTPWPMPQTDRVLREPKWVEPRIAHSRR